MIAVNMFDALLLENKKHLIMVKLINFHRFGSFTLELLFTMACSLTYFILYVRFSQPILLSIEQINPLT